MNRQDQPKAMNRPDQPLDNDGRESMVIDCDRCDVRGPASCDDCVVAFLLADGQGPLGAPRKHGHGQHAVRVELRLVEIDTLARLARAGLVPELQHRRGA